MLKEFFGLSQQEVVLFLLAFLRILALIVVAPLFGSQTIPVQIKIFFSLLLAVCLFPFVGRQVQGVNLSLSAIFLKAMKEIVTGLFIGFNTRLIFEGFQFAGRLIGNQMGLGIAELIDPESGAQVSPIENFLSIIAMVLFLTLNGHHIIIKALLDSFHILPLNGQQFFNMAAGSKLLSMFNDIFVVAVKLAAPAIVIFSLLEVSMGIIARVTPQMNIFFIGLPVRLGVGLFVLLASLPMFYLLLDTVIHEWRTNLQYLLIF